MAKKEVTREDFPEAGSVIPSYDTRLERYACFNSFVEKGTVAKRYFEKLNSKISKELKAAMDTGKYKTVQEARASLLDYKEGVPLYKRFASSPEEAVQIMCEDIFGNATDYLNNRDNKLRTLFCSKYLAPILLAAIKGGYCINYWWRAVIFGFSVEPYSYNKREEIVTYNAFPYTSIEEMPEGDKRAFLWVVEDCFYVIEESWRNKTVKDYEDKVLELGVFKPIPKEGISKSEIQALYEYMYESEGREEEYLENFEFEILAYFPIIMNRQEEAIYYAFKYIGNEYRDYIDSLSVEEDFNFTVGNNPQYKEVMKEGFVWHSDK